MSTDWDAEAVATVVDARMRELGVKQKAIAERAEVSTATLRAIQHQYRKHRPTPDTLARISKALGYPPGYLQDVSEGKQQPADDVSSDYHQPEPENVESEITLDMLAGRLRKLDTIEEYLNNVATVVMKIDKKLDRIAVDIQYPGQDHQD